MKNFHIYLGRVIKTNVIILFGLSVIFSIVTELNSAREHNRDLLTKADIPSSSQHDAVKN